MTLATLVQGETISQEKFNLFAQAYEVSEDEYNTPNWLLFDFKEWHPNKWENFAELINNQDGTYFINYIA